MGFTEFLTIVFIVLKLIGVITWSWWLVCLPEIIGIALYIALIVIHCVSVCRMNKTINKHFDEF